MERLTAMRNFVTVVEAGSFSNAARRLNVAKATITQSVKGLETHLGVRLLNRTTRTMQLTCEGRIYAERCRGLLRDVETLEREVVTSARAPSGELRIEVPAAIGQTFIVPEMLKFSERYPDVQTTVLLTDSASGLIDDGIDVAIQLGELQPSSLIARRIHTACHIACAAPGFLAEHRIPDHPSDLLDLPCLEFFAPAPMKPHKWLFSNRSEQVVISPLTRLRFNSSEALINIARLGGGVIYMLDILVSDYLRSGELVELLPEWDTLERGVYIVCPHRIVPARVQAFTSFLEDVFPPTRHDVARMPREPVPVL